MSIKITRDKTEVSPLIMIQDVDVKSMPTPEGFKKVFVSYNILTLQITFYHNSQVPLNSLV